LATKILSSSVDEREAGQLQPLARSAFRTLGLAASASQKEIYEKASSLRLAHKLGVEKRFDADLPWLGALSRSEADIRDALGRLADPPQRILERLFWFHAPPGVSRPKKVAALRAAADELLEAESPSARHDAALFLLAALHRLDSDFHYAEEWARAFTLWHEVVEREEFWSLLVAEDLKGDFEQLVTYGEVKRLRERTQRLLTTHVADRAREALARNDYAVPARALRLLRGAALPAPLLDEYEDALLGPVEDRVEKLCDEAFAWVALFFGEEINNQPKYFFDQAWKDFHWKLKPQLNRFVQLAGVESRGVRRTCERTAEKLSELAASYQRYGLVKQSLYVYRQARALAPPGSAPVPAIVGGLRALDPSVELRPRTDAEYAAALARELGETRPPPKLFYEEDIVSTKGGRGQTLKGCLAQAAFYLLMVAGCFLLNKCGIINSRRSGTRLPPSTFNFNYNAPRIVIPSLRNLNLEPLDISPLPTPGTPKRARRKQRPTRQQPQGVQGGEIDRPASPPPPVALPTPRRASPGGAAVGPPKN
jgi:hypothetical protein